MVAKQGYNDMTRII